MTADTARKAFLFNNIFRKRKAGLIEAVHFMNILRQVTVKAIGLAISVGMIDRG